MSPSTPFFGPDIRSSMRDIRDLTHGSGSLTTPTGDWEPSEDVLRAADVAGELGSILAIVDDLKKQVVGPTIRATEKCYDYMSAEGILDDVPFSGGGVIAAMKFMVVEIENLKAQVSALQGAE
ncbi:hypothetical protein VQ042_22120 [Aurantimonas sp. A2-1-M11]|uniref:hypothetical protein n=1 Tax=Aurantimonas sp. A2-1-M11 TaxID=3113712 RepID=UPI002F955846